MKRSAGWNMFPMFPWKRGPPEKLTIQGLPFKICNVFLLAFVETSQKHRTFLLHPNFDLYFIAYRIVYKCAETLSALYLFRSGLACPGAQPTRTSWLGPLFVWVGRRIKIERDHHKLSKVGECKYTPSPGRCATGHGPFYRIRIARSLSITIANTHDLLSIALDCFHSVHSVDFCEGSTLSFAVAIVDDHFNNVTCDLEVTIRQSIQIWLFDIWRKIPLTKIWIFSRVFCQHGPTRDPHRILKGECKLIISNGNSHAIELNLLIHNELECWSKLVS